MRLSIITITCRQKAGLEALALSLGKAASLAPGVKVEWVVVDEKLWAQDRACDLLARRRELAASGLVVLHLPPKPSVWRGPWRRTERDLPDPNGARNTGLALCSGDYAVFVDDNCLVSNKWMAGVCQIAREGHGYRAHVAYPTLPMQPRKDGFLPEDKVAGPPVRVTPTQCNGLLGAPMRAFNTIRGFDESYAGEMRWEDLDAVVRLDRIGVPFYSAGWGSVFHVKHALGEVCDDERVYDGTNNAKRWQALLVDAERILPAWKQPTLAQLRAELSPFPRDRDRDPPGNGGSNGTSSRSSGSAFSPPRGALARAAAPSPDPASARTGLAQEGGA